MLAAVVVTFSAGPTVLDRCLRALGAGGGVDHIVVVDTGGTATVADDLVDTIEVVRLENRGYGAAANSGFERARSHGANVFALLNDDAVPQQGWLPPLVAELGGEVGAVQPVLVGSDGTVASLGVELDEFGAGVDIGDGQAPELDAAPSEISIFTGGAVVFSDQFLRATGGFDERYFLYYEDVDLALRGTELGWRYRLVSASVVEHQRGTTTSAAIDRTLFLQERNRLWISFRFGDVRRMGSAVWLSIRRLRHRPRQVHARALVHGVAGAPVRWRERRVVRRAAAVSA